MHPERERERKKKKKKKIFLPMISLLSQFASILLVALVHAPNILLEGKGVHMMVLM
jgi:hypothetical protein